MYLLAAGIQQHSQQQFSLKSLLHRIGQNPTPIVRCVLSLLR